MNSGISKGIFLVAVGAACYGVLATLVKVGGLEGFSTAELTFSQSFVGLLALCILNGISNRINKDKERKRPEKRDKMWLAIGGIPLGLTSTFYYLSVTYVSVSVCIVLLMQSVWMGAVLDLIVNRTKPSATKIFAILIVLTGTILATNLLNSDISLDPRGIIFGLLAAVSYTLTMFASNKIAVQYPAITRSLYFMVGAFCTVALIWGYSLFHQFDINVLWRWGLTLAFFGTVLPPVLFAKGMPIIGIGLGSILASLELPVSVMMAGFVLGEEVNFVQWIGIIAILLAVVIMNYSVIKSR